MDPFRPNLDGQTGGGSRGQNERQWINSVWSLCRFLQGTRGLSDSPSLFWAGNVDSVGPLDQREPRGLAKKMSDPRLDSSRTIPMNRLTLSRTIQTTLQFGKELGSFRFLSGRDQGQKLLLRPASRIQKTPVHFPTTQGGASLFGGRGCVGHKRKQCLKRGSDVNP